MSFKIKVPVKRKDAKTLEGTITIPFGVRFGIALINNKGNLHLIEGITPEQIEEGERIIREIIGHYQSGEILDIKLSPRTNQLKVITKSLKAEEVNRLLKSVVIERIVEGLILEATPKKEKLHKQPRNLLKTIAKNISKTAEPTLFTIDTPSEVGLSENFKGEVSKTVAGLAYYLIQLYQENNSKPIVIDNLTPLAEKLGCTNYRLKLYLLYLGGFVYPITDIDPKTKELVLTTAQLFTVEFRYSERVAQRHSITNGIIDARRFGTDMNNFIKDEPVDRVIITPSDLFIKAIQGKGLGNILTVNDRFLELVLEVSPIAVKILSYSSSNQPNQKIGEDKLVTHLGLTRQVKVQGKPRVRATILKGFQELKDKGHIKEYSYEDSTGAFTYTYSDMYVKYREGRRGRLKGGLQDKPKEAPWGIFKTPKTED